jgi:hypothetical protein
LLTRLRNSTQELPCLNLHTSSAPWLSVWSGRARRLTHSWRMRSQVSAARRFEVAEATYRAAVGDRSASRGSWPHRRCWPARPDLGERWSSGLVATAEEDRLNVCCTTAAVISRHPNKEKSPDSEVGARLGYACHGGSPVTIRTVTDTHFLLNRAVSEIRLV